MSSDLQVTVALVMTTNNGMECPRIIIAEKKNNKAHFAHFYIETQASTVSYIIHN